MHCYSLVLLPLGSPWSFYRGLSVFWECGMFPHLWHWALWVVSTVNRKHGKERLRGGKAGEGKKGLWLCCTFCCSLKAEESHFIYTCAQCCTETVLITSQKETDQCKTPQQEPRTLENKPILVSVPWIYQTGLFGCEECRRVRWETKTKYCRKHQGKVTLWDPEFLSLVVFTETLRLPSNRHVCSL